METVSGMKRLMAFSLPLLLAGALAFSSCKGEADVTLPVYYSDGMVLQRDREIPVRGETSPGSVVKIEWRGSSIRAKADTDGVFSFTLPSSEAGGPYTLKVGAKTIENILVGDVFLCSGQSNMELPIRRCMDVVSEVVKGYSNDKIRYFQVPKVYEFSGPQKDIRPTTWRILDSDAECREWSAVCYFTARELFDKTGVPVGMVNSAVGGSPIEAWMGEEILPDYGLKELRTYQDQHYLDSIRHFNATLYSTWQEKHNSLPPSADKTWRKVDVFKTDAWAKERGQNIYGSFILRRRFSLSSSQTGQDAILHLGAMVDGDSVFVNSVYVGNTTYQYPPRNYPVPASALKEGENVVEVHLYAYGGNQAHFVPDKRYSLEGKTFDIPLKDGWEYRKGRRMEARPGEVFLQYTAAGLYNAMIAPLADIPFSGVIWYQGESNVGNAQMYSSLMTSMIGEWRKTFSNPSLPFYIIELAAFEHSELTDNDWGWNRVQKEQRRTAEKVDGVYLVPNADLGEWNDIHPQDKATVGRRTADVIIESKD